MNSDNNSAQNNDIPLMRVASRESLTSIGFSNNSVVSSPSNTSLSLTPSTGSAPEESIFNSKAFESENHRIPSDVICFIITCPRHNTTAFRPIRKYKDDYFYFFPTFHLEHDSNSHRLSKTIALFLESLIRKRKSEYRSKAKLVNIYRVRIPKIQKFVTRLIFQINIESNQGGNSTDACDDRSSSISLEICICGAENPEESTPKTGCNKRLTWLSLSQMASILPNSWGGELIEFMHEKGSLSPPAFQEIDEDSLENELANVSLGNRKIEDLTLSARYLFNEFMVQCFPSSSMTLPSFHMLCDKLGWYTGTWFNPYRLQNFQNFDKQSRGYLGYYELLKGLIDFVASSEEHSILFDNILQKFNCRNFASNIAQKLVEDVVMQHERCDLCSKSESDGTDKKYFMSSNVIKLSRWGDVRQLLRFKANPDYKSYIKFISDIPERTIFHVANEFINLIERISSESGEKINYFQTGRLAEVMNNNLELILEFSKRLLENQSPIVEVRPPGYIFGYLNGSSENLMNYGRNLFQTFPHMCAGFLLFLGNYVTIDEQFEQMSPAQGYSNLNCLIYLLCMKILLPTNVHLLRGESEQQILDRMNSKMENDIIKNLVQDIFELLPRACIIDGQIFASNYSISSPCVSMFQLRTVTNWSTSLTPLNNIDQMYYRYQMVENSKKNPNNQQYRIIKRRLAPFYEDLVDEMWQIISDDDDYLTKRIKQQQLKEFLRLNCFMMAINAINRSLQFAVEESEGLEFYSVDGSFDIASIVSTTKLNHNPPCVFVDRDLIRFICSE